MDKLKELIRAYVPWDEQEEKDRKLILDFMEGQPDCLERSNEIAHFTASAVSATMPTRPSPSRIRVLWTAARLRPSVANSSIAPSARTT